MDFLLFCLDLLIIIIHYRHHHHCRHHHQVAVVVVVVDNHNNQVQHPPTTFGTLTIFDSHPMVFVFDHTCLWKPCRHHPTMTTTQQLVHLWQRAIITTTKTTKVSRRRQGTT